ncbi:hypothetical protein [Bacillus sp. OV166]|uniref:thiolase family protein n=1 Tax=Bacillus sp. OV166 TaxID=1882763 RepID=UPI000B441690|nr:hypothetical protein [Bacillus sp. OV166]
MEDDTNGKIVLVEVKFKNQSTVFAKDEHMRETSLEKLASLKPVFKKNGTVTAGNACGRNDGASAIVLMTKEKAQGLGLKPLAKVKGWATVGVDPQYMGIGPVPAVSLLLNRSGLQMVDIGLIELNEAFAAQALAVAVMNYRRLQISGRCSGYIEWKLFTTSILRIRLLCTCVHLRLSFPYQYFNNSFKIYFNIYVIISYMLKYKLSLTLLTISSLLLKYTFIDIYYWKKLTLLFLKHLYFSYTD